MDLYQMVLVFSALVLVFTSFISHTVGAMVILPIVQSVGESMSGPEGPHPKLLVMAAALMCSGGCVYMTHIMAHPLLRRTAPQHTAVAPIVTWPLPGRWPTGINRHRPRACARAAPPQHEAWAGANVGPDSNTTPMCAAC